MKVRRNNANESWIVERSGASLVQLFSGRIRILVPVAEFVREWTAA